MMNRSSVTEYVRNYANYLDQEDIRLFTSGIFSPVMNADTPNEKAISRCSEKYLPIYADFKDTVLNGDQYQSSTDTFSMEIECHYLEATGDPVIFGGAGKTHRFMVGMFIIESVDCEVLFEGASVSTQVNAGDVLMFGPYFSNRFKVLGNAGHGLKIINIYSVVVFTPGSD
jgi:hypothetical protein